MLTNYELDHDTKVSQSIVANQIALFCNEQLKADPKHYKNDLKQKLNMLIPVLIKAEEKEYDLLFAGAERECTLIYDVMFGLCEKLAQMGLYRFGEIHEMLNAYEKDEASINGIVKKINRRS